MKYDGKLKNKILIFAFSLRDLTIVCEQFVILPIFLYSITLLTFSVSGALISLCVFTIPGGIPIIGHIDFIRKTMSLIVFVFIALMLLPTVSIVDMDEVEASDCCDDPISGGKGTVLFLAGNDPAAGDLTKDYPSGDYESVAINPDTALMRQDLGYWESQPLVSGWTVDSLIEFQIPAWGTGYSVNTTFFLEVFVGGQSQGEIETSSDGMMPMYMYWLTNETYSFTAQAGETFGMEISVLENGPGGELRWDSEEAIAQIWIRTPSIIIEVEDIPKGTRHESTMTAFSFWGNDDIESINMLILDPTLMNGGPVWDDIKNNATVYETTDSITIDWDDSGSEDGIRSGIWSWNLPADSPNFLEVVGYATDGGLIPAFKSGLIEQPDSGEEPGDIASDGSSEDSDDVPWMFIIGIMLVVGIAMGGYERKVMDHNFKQILLATITVVVVGIVVISTFHSAAFSSEKQSAPDFEIETIEGKKIGLDDLEDKVVVLSLTGITCSFCEPQMEEMVKVRQKFRDDEDVVFISVNIMTGDDDSAWREFRDELGADWDFAMDNDHMVGKFRITSMPVIIIIDKEGDIAYTHANSLLESDEFESKILDVDEGKDIAGLTFTGGSLMFAFFVGITAFFAPCAFPLLPGFMTYQLSRLKKEQIESDGYYDEDGDWYEPDEVSENPGILKGLKIGIAAMIGITSVMIAFALVGWLLEDTIQANLKYYTPALGIVIVALGAIFLLHIPLPTGNLKARIVNSAFYDRMIGAKVDDWQGAGGSEGSLHLGVMAYGAGYASASMGCHGPIFIAVLLLGLAGGFMMTVEMILLYALGMGICMIIVCVLVAAAENTAIDTLQDKLPLINKISGLFLIIAGIWIFWTGLPGIHLNS